MMLFDICTHTARLASISFESRKHQIFLNLVMMVYERTPCSGEEEEILDIVCGVHIWRLQVDAIDASNYTIMKMSHFICTMDCGMGFLFIVKVCLTGVKGGTNCILSLSWSLKELPGTVCPLI